MILVCLAGILVGCSSEASPALRGAETMNETAVVPQVIESQTAEASVELDGATSFDSGFVVAAEEATNVESLSAVGNACTSGVVGQVYSMAPACLDACSGSCGALGGAINAYLKQGGSAAAKKYVCSHKSSFYCPVTGSAKGKCAGLISKAASFGFHLPSSVGALNAECR